MPGRRALVVTMRPPQVLLVLLDLLFPGRHDASIAVADGARRRRAPGRRDGGRTVVIEHLGDRGFVGQPAERRPSVASLDDDGSLNDR